VTVTKFLAALLTPTLHLDGKNYYAVAVLNKAKAIRDYSGIVKANQATGE